MQRSAPDLTELRIDREARPSGGGSRGYVIVAMVGVVLLAIVAIFLFKGSTAAEVEVAVARDASKGGSGGAAAVLNASGYVTPRRKATVSAEITGRVTEMLVEEGMEVAAGQVLARLDDSELAAQLEVDRANREVASKAVRESEVTLLDAEKTLWRAKELREKGFTTQQELDRAETAADTAKARLALSREQLQASGRRVEYVQSLVDNCTVRAPFAGIAISKDAQVGEIVSPISAGGGFTRTGISTIVDMESLEVEVDVNESFIARVRPGQRVEAVLEAYPDWRIPASVRTTIPSADRQKATVKVRIKFDALDPRILPDMGVNVAFLRSEESGSATEASPRAMIPRQAVRENDGKKIVFVVRDEKAERRAVSAGIESGPDIEILAGVSGGELVVVKGPETLQDGDRVRIVSGK